MIVFEFTLMANQGGRLSLPRINWAKLGHLSHKKKKKKSKERKIDKEHKRDQHRKMKPFDRVKMNIQEDEGPNGKTAL